MCECVCARARAHKLGVFLPSFYLLFETESLWTLLLCVPQSKSFMSLMAQLPFEVGTLEWQACEPLDVWCFMGTKALNSGLQAFKKVL